MAQLIKCSVDSPQSLLSCSWMLTCGRSIRLKAHDWGLGFSQELFLLFTQQTTGYEGRGDRGDYKDRGGGGGAEVPASASMPHPMSLRVWGPD